MPIEDPTSRDWPELAARAAATGQPWAGELASHVETFLAIAHFVDTCERPGPGVLTHNKDIQPWNLLAREDRPVVLDWELSGMLDLSSELGSAALSLAKGPGFDDIKPAIFRSVLDKQDPVPPARTDLKAALNGVIAEQDDRARIAASDA